MVPKWSDGVVQFLTTGSLKDVEESLQEKSKFLEACRQFLLLFGRLYYLGNNEIMRLVVNPKDYYEIMSDTHVSTCGFHFSIDGMIK